MSNKKINFFCVNGILTKPSDIGGWCDYFEDYYQNEGYPCTKYEYFSGAITRFIKQGKRVEEICTILERISNPIVYVGHSNGCELFSKVVKKTKAKFVAAHLFAPAMESDFDENGLNYALLSGKVQQVYLYCSKKDQVLKNYASKTSFLKFIGLGYGTLGYTGHKNVLPQVQHRVSELWKKDYDHSTWFSENNIKETHELTYRGL